MRGGTTGPTTSSSLYPGRRRGGGRRTDARRRRASKTESSSVAAHPLPLPLLLLAPDDVFAAPVVFEMAELVVALSMMTKRPTTNDENLM
jgi:hypothetical protein